MSGNYDPNKQGWGFAGVICLMAAGLFFMAYTVHNRTYRNPRDPMMTQTFEEKDGK